MVYFLVSDADGRRAISKVNEGRGTADKPFYLFTITSPQSDVQVWLKGRAVDTYVYTSDSEVENLLREVLKTLDLPFREDSVRM